MYMLSEHSVSRAKTSRAKEQTRKAVLQIMDREPAMAANCEAGFGSCNRDTSVNQAHNQ